MVSTWKNMCFRSIYTMLCDSEKIKKLKIFKKFPKDKKRYHLFQGVNFNNIKNIFHCLSRDSMKFVMKHRSNWKSFIMKNLLSKSGQSVIRTTPLDGCRTKTSRGWLYIFCKIFYYYVIWLTLDQRMLVSITQTATHILNFYK